MSLASVEKTANDLHPRYIGAPSPISVEDALSRFAAPAGSVVKVQILRPFSVYSKTAYSSVMTLQSGRRTSPRCLRRPCMRLTSSTRRARACLTFDPRVTAATKSRGFRPKKSLPELIRTPPCSESRSCSRRNDRYTANCFAKSIEPTRIS